MIRGKKNFLPPSQLEMGLAVLFLLGDDDSLLRHKNERRDFALMGDASESEDELDEAPTARKRENDAASNGLQTKAPGTKDTAAENGEEVDDAPEKTNSTKLENDNVGETTENKATAVGNGQEMDNGGNNRNQKKKGLSARDRRLIKKYGSLEAADKAIAQRDDEEDGGSEAPRSTKSDTPTEQKPLKRGRKAKEKKMMRKYADQDDEDRELAMLALQGGEKVNKKKTAGSKRDPKVSEKQQEVAAETVALLVKDASSVADQLADEVRSVLAECVTVRTVQGENEEGTVRWDKFDAETIEQLISLDPVEAQVAAASRLLELKSTTRVDNFSASLGGK